MVSACNKLVCSSGRHGELNWKQQDCALPGATDNVANCSARQACLAPSDNLIRLPRAQNYHISRGVPKFP